MNAAQFFSLVARAQFAPFTQQDWDCFAGCSSDNPQIADVDGFTIILDGDVAQVICPDESVWQISLRIEEI